MHSIDVTETWTWHVSARVECAFNRSRACEIDGNKALLLCMVFVNANRALCNVRSDNAKFGLIWRELTIVSEQITKPSFRTKSVRYSVVRLCADSNSWLRTCLLWSSVSKCFTFLYGKVCTRARHSAAATQSTKLLSMRTRFCWTLCLIWCALTKISTHYRALVFYESL